MPVLEKIALKKQPTIWRGLLLLLLSEKIHYKIKEKLLVATGDTASVPVAEFILHARLFPALETKIDRGRNASPTRAAFILRLFIPLHSPSCGE